MKLTFNPEDHEPIVHETVKASFIIGRSPSCDISLSIEGISRQHCQVDFQEGDIFITDLGSTNGVFIDGRRIPPKIPVRYQVFLPLSIGSIPIVTLETDGAPSVAERYAAQAALNAESTDNLTRTLVVPRRDAANRGAPSRNARTRSTPILSAVEKDERKSNLLINLIAVLILLLGVFWFFSTAETPPVENPAQTPTSVKNFNDNGHF